MSMTDKETIEYVQSYNNRERVSEDYNRFLVFNGKVKEIVRKAISKEFELQETVDELSGRIVPINLVQKIITKLAMVYKQAPYRKPLYRDPGDQELLDLYTTVLKMNMNGKLANRFFKLHKHTVWEPFLDYEGIPRLRTIASHMYTPISEDPIQPGRPTKFVKHIYTYGSDLKKHRYQIWTDEEFKIVDGNGYVLKSEMDQLNNRDGINPYGKIPFIYIAENDDGRLIPISDDDLINMQVVINLLLTDLNFASKYQLWSLLVLKNSDGTSKISFNPNSIINLPPGAELDVVKPDVNIDAALRQVEALVGMLLTSKNLSVGDVTGQVSAAQVSASGISKMVDRAESTEDRQDQEAYFIDAEKRFFNLFAHYMLPVWVDQNVLHREYIGKFTDEFEVSIQFQDPRPFLGDKETIEVEKMKMDNGLTTRFQAIKNIHPDLESSEIEDLISSIDKEKAESIRRLQEGLNGSQA